MTRTNPHEGYRMAATKRWIELENRAVPSERRVFAVSYRAATRAAHARPLLSVFDEPPESRKADVHIRRK